MKYILCCIIFLSFSCIKSKTSQNVKYITFYKVNEKLDENENLILYKGEEKLSEIEIKELEKVLTKLQWKYKRTIDNYILIEEHNVSTINRMYNLGIEWKTVPLN